MTYTAEQLRQAKAEAVRKYVDRTYHGSPVNVGSLGDSMKAAEAAFSDALEAFAAGKPYDPPYAAIDLLRDVYSAGWSFAAMSRLARVAELSDVLDAMRLYGGGFVAALAEAWQRGDSQNQDRLMSVFSDVYERYRLIAQYDLDRKARAKGAEV